MWPRIGQTGSNGLSLAPAGRPQLALCSTGPISARPGPLCLRARARTGAARRAQYWRYQSLRARPACAANSASRRPLRQCSARLAHSNLRSSSSSFWGRAAAHHQSWPPDWLLGQRRPDLSSALAPPARIMQSAAQAKHAHLTPRALALAFALEAELSGGARSSSSSGSHRPASATTNLSALCARLPRASGPPSSIPEPRAESRELKGATVRGKSGPASVRLAFVSAGWRARLELLMNGRARPATKSLMMNYALIAIGQSCRYFRLLAPPLARAVELGSARRVRH